MVLSYRDLIERVATLTQLAIQNKVRSDVYCRKLIEFVNGYGVVGHAAFVAAAPQPAAPQPAADEASVFGGRAFEDFSKLGARAREADMTPEQEQRLKAADDEGRSLLDDGDPFTD